MLPEFGFLALIPWRIWAPSSIRPIPVGTTQLASRMCVTKSAQLWETQAHTCGKQCLGLHFRHWPKEKWQEDKRKKDAMALTPCPLLCPGCGSQLREESTVPTARVVLCPLERTPALGNPNLVTVASWAVGSPKSQCKQNPLRHVSKEARDFP